jgi:hypothetical protein
MFDRAIERIHNESNNTSQLITAYAVITDEGLERDQFEQMMDRIESCTIIRNRK